MLCKVKSIIIGTRMAGTAISRQQVINTARGKANNPSLLIEFCGELEPTENWARTVLKSLNWTRRKGTTGKLEPPDQLLADEKFTFQRNIALLNMILRYSM